MMPGDHNDYSVCKIRRADENDVYLIDVYRARLEYPDLRRRVISHAEVHRAATILIEDAGPGMNLLQDLRRSSMPEGTIRPIGVKPEGGKVERMAAQSAKIEAGQVHLPKSTFWLDDFESELLAFPRGRHEDEAGSVSQFLFWGRKFGRGQRRRSSCPLPRRGRDFGRAEAAHSARQWVRIRGPLSVGVVATKDKRN